MQEISQQPDDELNEVPQLVLRKQGHGLTGIIKLARLSRADVAYALSLAVASLIAYYILEPFVNQPNDFLGVMWATIATVFVFGGGRNSSLRAAVGSLLCDLRFTRICRDSKHSG